MEERPGPVGLPRCPVSTDTLTPVLSWETQSQAGWVGPETVPSPGAAASAGAHYTLHSSCIRIARATFLGLKGPESERWAARTTEPECMVRPELPPRRGGRRGRQAGTPPAAAASPPRGGPSGTWGAASCPNQSSSHAPAWSPRAAEPWAGPGLRPDCRTPLPALASRRLLLGFRSREGAPPASAAAPLLSGFAGSQTGLELTPPDRPRALQAVRARLVQGFPGRPVLGLGLRSPCPSTPPRSVCPKTLPTPPLTTSSRGPPATPRPPPRGLWTISTSFSFFPLHHLSHVLGRPERHELQERPPPQSSSSSPQLRSAPRGVFLPLEGVWGSVLVEMHSFQQVPRRFRPSSGPR